MTQTKVEIRIFTFIDEDLSPAKPFYGKCSPRKNFERFYIFETKNIGYFRFWTLSEIKNVRNFLCLKYSDIGPCKILSLSLTDISSKSE